MSNLDELTAPAAAVQVIADVAREQRRAWAQAVLGSRQTLWLDAAEDGPATLRRALDADTPPAAVAWIAGLERSPSLDAVRELLRELAEAGAGLVVAVPNTRLDASLDEDGTLELGWDEARALAGALGADLVEQRLAEAALIGEPGDGPLTGSVVGAAGEPDDASAWLLVTGVEPGSPEADLQFSAQPVHRAYLAALEAANAELLRANTRLARANLGRHDAGAASVLARFESGLAEREAELAQARGEIARLEERLELEVQVAAQNDRFFQETRATLMRPEHRAVTGLVARIQRVPGGRLVLRLVRRAVSR